MTDLGYAILAVAIATTFTAVWWGWRQTVVCNLVVDAVFRFINAMQEPQAPEGIAKEVQQLLDDITGLE